MDLDGDGDLDVLSGSYDPGDLYLFRGRGQGKWEAQELLEDVNGVPLVHHPKELAEYRAIQESTGQEHPQEKGAIGLRVASFGSWPATVDWDGDGDLDVLIGSFRGELFLRRNEGTRTEPRFAGESEQVEADGEPLRVDSHCCPACADWDADGRWDLIVSASDGSVGWYRNTGTAEAPRFGARRLLIEPRAPTKFWTQYLEPGQAPAPGVRVQICVTDHDGDGLLDLLAGDYSQITALRKLAPEERTAFDALLAEERALEETRAASMRDPAKKTAFSAAYQEIAAKKKAYVDHTVKSRTASFVWLFRRAPESAVER